MSSLAISSDGHLMLKREFLQHLGIRPGDSVELEMMPDGVIRLYASKPTGTIDSFIGRHAGKVQKALTIEEINQAVEAGWAGEA